MKNLIIDSIISAIIAFITTLIYHIVTIKMEKRKNKQTTFVYCPKCNNELVKNGNLIKDTDFVYFKCSKCGHESKWDFDFPCPILIEEVKDETII